MMADRTIATDFLRSSPLDVSCRVAGGSLSVVSPQSQIVAETSAGRSVAAARVSVPAEEVSE